MTKKDYELVIKGVVYGAKQAGIEKQKAQAIVSHLALILGAGNMRFDHKIFFAYFNQAWELDYGL